MSGNTSRKACSLNVPKLRIYNVDEMSCHSNYDETYASQDFFHASRYKLRNVLTMDKPNDEKETYSLLWVQRPVAIWAIQAAVAIFSIFDATLSGLLSYKGSLLGSFNRYMLLEILTGIPLILSRLWPSTPRSAHGTGLCLSLMNWRDDRFSERVFADPKWRIFTLYYCSIRMESKLRLLLQVPLWAQRVTYLKGSALNDQDLIRANDRCGRLFYTDRSRNPDLDSRDHQTIVRTWAIQDFAPETPLYVQIHKPENKFHVSFAEHVVCEDEIKNALLASNCICPGISTLVTLLLHTLREQKGITSDAIENIYGRSAGNEIYDIRLGDSKMFRKFVYKSFTNAAYNAFRRYGVTLIGVRREPPDSHIFLNPGPNFKLAWEDTLFYIAITSEEDMVLEEFTKLKSKPKKMSSATGKAAGRLSKQNIELTLTERNSNCSVMHSSEGESQPVDSPVERKVVSLGDFNELPTSDVSEAASDADVGDLSGPIQSIPNYVIGVPPITPYVGRTPLKCHLLPEPKPFCCMELNKVCKVHKLYNREERVKTLSGGVIVACPGAGAGLYNFILPLRAYYRPKCSLNPLIILLNERPSPAFYEAVCSFPLLYFMVGSFKNVDDLLQAGILEAETVVITDQLQSIEGIYQDEEYMGDAYTIVGVQTIYRLFPKVELIVELTHSSNMKFMKFSVPVLPDKNKKETIKKVSEEQEKDPFAAGNVFSASMIDTLLYQTFMKDYMVELIALLLGCEQNAESGFLDSYFITENDLWIKNYGRLFQRLCNTTYDIPIGLYRHVKTSLHDTNSERIPEDKDIYGIVTNRLKRLGLKGEHDLSYRQGKSYSLVNPPPDFELEEGLQMKRRIRSCHSNFFLIQILIFLQLKECSGSSLFKFQDVHLSMTKRDLGKIFGVELANKAYDITYPSYSTSIRQSELKRIRRSDERVSDRSLIDSGFGLNAFGRSFNFSLSLNKNLLAPNFKLETVRENGTLETKTLPHNCHYIGKVDGGYGSAAFSNCDGLTGLFTSEEHDYFIHPVPNYVKDTSMVQSSLEPHIVFRRSIKQRHKRSTSSSVTDSLFNAAISNAGGRFSTRTCGTKDDPSIRITRAADEELEGISLDNKERYIESLVVVDQKMCNYHGEDAATQFTMAVLNMVSSLLRDSSIGSNLINLVVVKMQLLTIDPTGLTINHHAQNTLNSFGIWASSHSDPDDNSDDHYDYAFLLTRYNICADKNQDCDLLGLTEVGGMCKWPYSASVNEDNGLPLAFTMTHELGHSLGMNHDGKESSFICPDGTYLMSTTNVGKESGYTWSRCSRNYLRQFLSKKQSACLMDLPGKARRMDFEKIGNKAGILYDQDKQCEMILGTGSKFCKEKSEQVCLRLWCTNPLSKDTNCIATNYPAADATTCGPSKWCMRGKCISVDKPIAVEGGWSLWSRDFSKCSRSCGGGVQYRERICNSPKPKFGGKHCEGESRSYQVCNKNSCPDNAKSYRQGQCERLNNRLFGEKYFEWQFKASRIPPCKLGCFIKNTQHGYDFGNVDDGTNCDQMDGSILGDKCINGECINIGCDGIIGSKAKYDRCGVCNGDGRSCSSAEARSDTPEGDGISDALKSLKEMGFDMGTLYGKAELSLAARRSGIPHSPNDTTVSEFIWAKIKSGCSVSCGGGIETISAQCRRQDDGSPVPENRCDARLKPNTQEYSCKKELCPATWQTSYWGDCSRTCNGGVKRRHVRCVQFGQQGIEYEVDESLCVGSKPANQEVCNREPCPPEWIAQPFGECSTVCDPGVQVRQILCQKSLPDRSSVTVKDSECSKDTKPPTEQKCNVHNPCPGTADCGGIFTNTSGLFASPNFPNNYPNNMECVYIIQVAEGKMIELRFDSLRISSPGQDDCKADFVKVMDGDCVSRLGESKFCGSVVPSKFESTTNRLCVKFYSDDSQNDQGFSASYQAIDFPTQQIDLCDTALTSPAGMVSSPNYPEYYPSNEDCNMTIITEESPIKLTFEAFDVGSEDCSNDFVHVRGGEESKKYCGKKGLPPYVSKGNKLWIRFYSSSHPATTKSGFVATYTSGKVQGDISQMEEAPKKGKDNTQKQSKEKANTRDQIPHNPTSYNPGVTFIKSSEITNGINKDLDLAASPNSLRFSKKMHIPVTDDGPLWIPEPADQGENFMVAPRVEMGRMPKKVSSQLNQKSTKSEVKSRPFALKEQQKMYDQIATKFQPVKSAKSIKKTFIAKPEIKKHAKAKKKQKGKSRIQHNLDGKLGECPKSSTLTCIKLLLSYPCENEDQCNKGLACCETNCEYGRKMCVQKVTKHCPLRDPYYFPRMQCQDENDCPGKAPCCRDMAGARYCRPPRIKILNRLHDD
eukprot:gene15619-17196_t